MALKLWQILLYTLCVCKVTILPKNGLVNVVSLPICVSRLLNFFINFNCRFPSQRVIEQINQQAFMLLQRRRARRLHTHTTTYMGFL
jgi:hypothetical protein